MEYPFIKSSIIMVSIPDYSGINLDSCEKAIVWSALLLRKEYFEAGDNTLRDIFKIGLKYIPSAFSPHVVAIQAILPTIADGLASGGSSIDSLDERVQGTTLYTGGNLDNSTGVFVTLPATVPSNVNTLERFFLWAAQQRLAANSDKFSDNIITPQFTGTTPAVVRCGINIPYDLVSYLLSNNLVNSLFEGESPNQSSTLVGNEILFGNEFLVGNN